MRARTGFVAVLGLVAAAACGCAGSSGGGLAQSPPQSNGASGPHGSVTPAPPSASGASQRLSLSGVVRQGAEPSCLILETSTGEYELQGPRAQRVRPESHVQVEGHLVYGVASHCMQGKPFYVTSVTP